MTVSEKFVVQFKADDTELKKSYENLEKSNDKIEISLEQIEKKAEKAADNLMGFAKKVGGFLTAMFATSQGIGATVDNAKEIVRLSDFSKSIQSNIEDVDALNKAIQGMGGEQSNSESNMSSLFSSITDAAKDTSSEVAKTFKKMGVSVKDSSGKVKSLMEVMGDLSQTVSSMDERKAEAFLKSLGITDQATLELMMKGRSELKATIRAQKEMGVYNAESERKAKELNASLGKLSVTFGRLKGDMTESASPALTWLIDKFEKLIAWMRENKPFVLGFFGSIAAVLLGVYAPALWSAAIATWAAVSPILAIVAPLLLFAGALALVIDDIYNFIQGNDSLIGRLLEAYPEIKAFVDDTLAIIYDVIDGIKEWYPKIRDEISIFINDIIIGMTAKIKEWQESFSKFIGDTIDSVIGFFKNMWKEFEEVYNKIMNGINAITSAKNKVVDGTNTWLMDKAGVGEVDMIVPEMTDEKKREKGWLPDENGILTPPYKQRENSFFQQADNGQSFQPEKNISLFDPNSMKAIIEAASQATRSAILMPDIKSIIQEGTKTISGNTTATKSIKIDKIEVIAQGGDPQTIAKNITAAVEKAFADQLDNFQSEIATGLV